MVIGCYQCTEVCIHTDNHATNETDTCDDDSDCDFSTLHFTSLYLSAICSLSSYYLGKLLSVPFLLFLLLREASFCFFSSLLIT